MSQRTLYILYNADSSVYGKLKYGYKKLFSSGEEPACDITHGGLSLKESPKWVDAKKEIESHNVKVVQWHRDEMDAKMRDWLKANGHHYPAVLLDDGSDSYIMVMSSADLNACSGDPSTLLEELKKKKALGGQKPS